MARPTSFLVLSIVFAGLCILAVANLIGVAASPELVSGLGLEPLVLLGSAGAYAATSGLAAIGLWRAAAWATRAMSAWAIAFDVGALAFVFTAARADLLPPMPPMVWLIAVPLFLCVPWLLVLYVRGRASRSDSFTASSTGSSAA